MISNKNLESMVAAYKTGEINKDRMLEAFCELAENVFTHKSYNFDHPNPKILILESGLWCLEKVERYDSAKGKAFNYFTTNICCFIRQAHGQQRHLKKLTEAK